MDDGQDVRRPGHRMNLLLRGLLLFLIGVFLALVLNLLQVQRNVTLFPPDVLSSLLSSAWWVPLCCGTAAAAIGLLYPCIDRQLGKPHRFKREWSSVLRCVAVFVGINHASAVSFLLTGVTHCPYTSKVDFANNLQLSLTLAALSIGLWWTFDRSRSGLGLGVCIAFFATLVSQLLVYNGVYQYRCNQYNGTDLTLSVVTEHNPDHRYPCNQYNGTDLTLSVVTEHNPDHSYQCNQYNGTDLTLSVVTEPNPDHRYQCNLYNGTDLTLSVVTEPNPDHRYTSPDFLYVRSWLPSIFFAGGITMGNIGRQLEMYERKSVMEKSHKD
ncbi:unnamed protein product [Ranitomeya imitator]|uniref:Insulin-induced gene protein n=1 Tax=Ranitomeya imitator TaxID=111125 RepID=A0ABN9KXF9_9NEOB|nr:unnamed protein product [Ranitomeya imitator]